MDMTESQLRERLRKIAALFVVDDSGRPLGVLHFHDLLKLGAA